MSSLIGLTQQLSTLKCYLCCENESPCHYLMLPSDCITAPVIPLNFRDEHGQPSAIEMRCADGGGDVEIFVQQAAVIKAESTRSNNLSNHPVYRKGKQHFYRVDGALLDRLRLKKGSIVAAQAVQRLEALLANVGSNREALVRAHKEKISSMRGSEDVEKIVSVLDWCMRSLGERGVLQQVYEAKGKAYGLTTSAALPVLPDVEHPNCKVYEFRTEFWDSLFVEGRKHFGVKDPDQFKIDQVLGKHRRLPEEIVAHRPYIHKYVIHFPDNFQWTNDDDDREWGTINRMLWEAEKIDPEAAEQFASGLEEDVLAAIGYTLPYVMRKEDNKGNSGCVRHVNAFDLLRFGFYSAVVNLCTKQTDNFRRAMLDKNKLSLTTKLLQCHLLTDSERKEVGFLNLAYERLLQAATRHISVKQIKQGQAEKQGLPSAFEVMKVMHKLDTENGSPDAKMLLCFLGLAYFCGLRSADMGRLMVPSYRAGHTGHHNLLVIDKKTGEMWLGSTKCKTVNNDMKVLLLPDWLKKWVEDYVQIRGTMVKLKPAYGETSGTHSGMWFTALGGAVHRDSGASPYHGASIFGHVFRQLHILAPEMKRVTKYTDLRSIFFAGTSKEVSGSMMNLFANAQEFMPEKKKHAGLRTDVKLPMEDDITNAMEVLNRSNSQAVYTDNALAPLQFVADYYDAAKKFVWAIMK